MSYIGTNKIGSMYLGSTEISKAYLGTSLVYQKDDNLSEYVQDGLLLHLDGKKKGSSGTSWISCVNNYTYGNYGATFMPDHVYFDGVDDYLRSASPSANIPSRSNGTIEIVIDDEGFGNNETIFLPRNTNKIAATLVSNGGILYGTDNTSARAYKYPLRTKAKASYSLNSTRRMENGQNMELSSNTSYASGINTSYNYIGKRSANDIYFKGKIYSIRIYSRVLTLDEVMQNLSVDNVRFNLGLSLQ